MQASLLNFLDSRLTKSAERIYVKPNIPRDKAKNAINSYANYLNYNDIVVLIDNTAFNNCKEGMIFTNKEIIAKATFKPTIYREMREISSLEFKKGLISSTILIDGQKFSLEQPSKDNIQHLVEKCNEYLTFLSSNPNIEFEEPEPDPEPDPQIVFLENELDKLKQKVSHLDTELKNREQKITQLELELENKSKEVFKLEYELNARSSSSNTSENNEISEVMLSPLADTNYSKQSLFSPVPGNPDACIRVAREHLSASNRFINALFTSDNLSSIADIITESLARIVVEIRENHIDKNNISALKNDLATMESLIYATAIIKNELLALGMNARFLSSLLNESLDQFFLVSQNKSPNAKNLANYVASAAFEDSPEQIQADTYAIRLYLANRQGKPIPTKSADVSELPIFQEIIEKYLTEEFFSDCISTEDAILKIIRAFSMEVFNEIGQLPFNQNIISLKRDTCNRVFQLAKQNGLI